LKATLNVVGDLASLFFRCATRAKDTDLSRNSCHLFVCRRDTYLGFRGRLAAKRVKIPTNSGKSTARSQRQSPLAFVVAIAFLQILLAAVDEEAFAAPKNDSADKEIIHQQNVEKNQAAGDDKMLPTTAEVIKSRTPDRTSSAQLKVALVLGGGGARGAAHIGVLRVLEENNLKPDLIVANSMGSVIGSLYCAGVPLDKIEQLCVDGKVKKAFAPFPLALQVMKKAARPKIPFMRIKRYPGLYNGDSLEAFINKTVGEEHTKIESLEIPLVITVVNLLDGKAYRMTKGDLGKIVRASCSLPPIVKPVEYEGMLLADGGIRTNLPTMTARDIGADIVIAVNVDETLSNVTAKEMQKLTLLGNRVTSIMLAVRDEQFAKVADLVIHPDVSGVSIISVNDEDYPLAIEAGRVAATAALPKLKKLFGAQTALKPLDPSKNVR
jgi:NTE family protein